MNPLKLLFLLISILLSFFSINPANAQTQIFTNITCEQITNCPDYFYEYGLGFGINAPMSETQKQNFLNNICKAKTNNDNSTSTNHLTDRYGDMLINFNDNKNGNSFNYFTEGYKITSITCEVPPPKIPGCTNPQALNYDPQATEENGTCQEKIEGCTDNSAINYNPQANVHIESQCQYPPEGPSEITGFFENSPTIQIGATTWTLRLKTNVENAYLNITQIQTWDQFKVTEYTTENKDIIITMKQFDDDRLNIEECTNYEITIPKDAITAQIQNRTGTETIKNFSAITGNFSVKGCPEKPTNDDEQTGTGKIQEIQQKYKSTMNKDAFYVRLFDVDEDGNQHINLGNFIFLIGFAGFFISAMFLFLNFLKNSFIGKKSSR